MKVEIAKLRSCFSISIVDPDASARGSMAATLKAVGYQDVTCFEAMDSAIESARQSPPHIILFDYDRLELLCESSLMEIQTVSSEILIFAVVSAEKNSQALQLVSRSLIYDTMIRPFVSSLELLQNLDRAARTLYFQFESEQLRDALETANASVNRVRDDASSIALLAETGATKKGRLPGDLNVLDKFGSADILSRCLDRLASTKEIEPSIQIFLDGMSEELSEAPVLWFKYIPSHLSLMVSHTSHLPIEKFRGVGIDLRSENPATLRSQFSDPVQMDGIKNLIRQLFARESFSAWTLWNDSEVVGVAVILERHQREIQNHGIQALCRAFEIAYKRNVTLKEKHALDFSDSLTGVFNRRYFTQRLDEEISRSRRLMMPVSLITVAIDSAGELGSRIGSLQLDSITKMIAAMLKKTARSNDLIARIGSHEFACLLPHTSYRGATVKAERIRRMIEATRFPALQTPDRQSLGTLSVSCGVSEYPSFCNDAEGLISTADEALTHIKKLEGNKVCLASPPDRFQMDFQPRDASSGPLLNSQARTRDQSNGFVPNEGSEW